MSQQPDIQHAGTRHPNAEQIEKMLQAFGQGDLGSVGANFAPDAVWELPGRSVIAGTFTGPEAVIGFLAKSYELSGGTLSVEPIAVLGTDWGAVQVQRVTANRDGRKLDCVEVLAHQMDHGLIRHTYHRPDQYALDAFFTP